MTTSTLDAPIDALLDRLGSDNAVEQFLAELPEDELRYLPYAWDELWARPAQRTPPDDVLKAAVWRTWLVLAGRGFGKTRTGAEWCREQVNNGRGPGMLVGQTPGDVRDVMIEGPTGLLSVFPPDQRPQYEPSKLRVTFHNGIYANIRSGADPDALRGPQFAWGWCDELAAFMYAQEVWDNFQYGLRVGRAQGCVTTTPRPIKALDSIADDPLTVVTGGSTFENRANLPAATLAYFEQKYGGTTLGQQELYAVRLREMPGALWSAKLLEACRVPEPPADKMVPVGPYSRRLTLAKGLKRIVIGVDPAVTAHEDSNLTGIVVAGIDGRTPAHGYVLADLSGRFTPEGWAKEVVKAYATWHADMVVGEVNNGGDLVERNLRTVSANVPFRAVRATRGKYKRAEPVAGIYEQGRFHHVGVFPELEDQQRTWLPGDIKASPDRLDALVWAAFDLLPLAEYTRGVAQANF